MWQYRAVSDDQRPAEKPSKISHIGIDDVCLGRQPANSLTGAGYDMNGAIAGGQIGYNWQSNKARSKPPARSPASTATVLRLPRSALVPMCALADSRRRYRR
jgi:hypothetical protein